MARKGAQKNVWAESIGWGDEPAEVAIDKTHLLISPELRRARKLLEIAGVRVVYIGDERFRINLGPEEGFLFQIQTVHVYTQACPVGPLCKLLSSLGITFSTEATGPW